MMLRSGVPLDQQTAETKLWIRDSFLCHRGPFPKYIVHGHTPTIYLDPQQTMPDVRDNRCNVDTRQGWNLDPALCHVVARAAIA
jgi:serine/threonine protein phosphatase 1